MKKLLTIAMVTSLSIAPAYSMNMDNAKTVVMEIQNQVQQGQLADKIKNLATAIQQGNVNVKDILQGLDINQLFVLLNKYGSNLADNLGNVLGKIAEQYPEVQGSVGTIKSQLANVDTYLAQLAQYKDSINPATHATEISNALEELSTNTQVRAYWNKLQANLPAIQEQANLAYNKIKGLTADDFTLLANFANAAKKAYAGQDLTTDESDSLFIGIDTINKILPALAKLAQAGVALGSEIYTQVNGAQLANNIPANVKAQLDQALPVLRDNAKMIADKLQTILAQ